MAVKEQMIRRFRVWITKRAYICRNNFHLQESIPGLELPEKGQPNNKLFLGDRVSIPSKLIPSHSWVSIQGLLVNILDNISGFETLRKQLVFHLTELLERPTRCNRWIEDSPRSLFGVHTIHPSHPQRLTKSVNMPSKYSYSMQHDGSNGI